MQHLTAMENAPLRLTHEHARALADSLTEWEARMHFGLNACGYADSAIDQEIALLHAHRAAAFGIDLLNQSTRHPVEKGRNGV